MWRILEVRVLTEVSWCGIFPIPSWQYSKRQTRGEDIKKYLDGGLEPTYYLNIFTRKFETNFGTLDPTVISGKNGYTN